MKISIQNFKSIKRLLNFEIKPLTVISGINSSGKSSFIQLLLLFKQTIELDSSRFPLYLNGDYYKVSEYKDILYNKSVENNLEVTFEFSKNEVTKIDDPVVKVLNSFDDYNVSLTLQFDLKNEKIIVSKFENKIELPGENKNQIITFDLNKKDCYTISANTELYGKGLMGNEALNNISSLSFLSFYPSHYEKKDNEKIIEGYLKLDWVKALINSFFENISYIGPLREQPKDEYSISKNHLNVGIKGEFVAQILETHAQETIEYYKIIKPEDGITYERVNGTLIEAVNYWMCEIFAVVEKIYAQKSDDTYKIVIEKKSELLLSIKHVGFGISQLLPIVVEGLRLPSNGTLVLEQPEIHLHPKVQSSLYDFLYGLTKLGKSVIIETHSSHFITRMRRRMAEDQKNEMDDCVNLTFIENNNFRTLNLDDYGILDYYPEDFIEPPNSELRAIVKAQMSKRLKNE